MLENLKEVTDTIIKVDEKLGFNKIIKYTVYVLLIVSIFNYKSIIRFGIEIVASINSELHSEKIELRDQLLSELYPILTEFRSDVRADRILYFEYHNSKENLIGIPFKYLELVQQSPKYGVPPVGVDVFKSIGTGSITSIYESVKNGNLVYCDGPDDIIFDANYPGIYELMSRGGSKRQIFISIPGINQPIGLIILEWMNESVEIDLDITSKISSQNYIPRINALILSKQL